MKRSINIIGVLFVLLMNSYLGQAQESTKVMIRAKAKDAKFIGTSIGGAQILVKNAQTGQILDQGITLGSTGDTEKIMKEDHQRGVALSNENTAGFIAQLKIDKPTFVTVEALSPRNAKQAQVISSTQLWVIPGKNIMKDGVVLEIPGFIVDVLSPQRHNTYETNKIIRIKANVVMMCGCTITADGVWSAKYYETKALVYKNEELFTTIDLHWSANNTFSGEMNLESGLYEIDVYVYDSVTGNTGVDRTNIIVQ